MHIQFDMSRVSASIRQRGIALISVLWVSVLLALLAGQVTRLSRGDLHLAYNLHQGTRAELAADSALWTAMYAMLNGNADAWRIDGTVYHWRLGDAEVRVQATDELGRVNLNRSGAPLLASLFRAAGVEPERAANLAEAVVMFRENKAGPGDGGASGGSSGRVRRPFEMVEQLLVLPGMSPGLFDRIANDVTIYGREGWPAAESASPLVLAAMEDRVLEADPGEGGQAALAPPVADAENLPEAPEIFLEPAAQGPTYADFFRIHAEALTTEGVHFSREAVVSFGTRSSLPWDFLLWTRGDRLLFPTAPGPGS